VQDAIKKMQSQLPWPESYDYGNGQGNCTPLVGSISAWAVWISGWLTAHTAAHPQQPKMEGILEEEVRLGAQSRDWNPPRITCAVDRRDQGQNCLLEFIRKGSAIGLWIAKLSSWATNL